MASTFYLTLIIHKNIVFITYFFYIFIYRQTLNSTGVNGKLLSRDVIYQGMKNITRIRALDLNVNGTGGYASIVQGGIGKKNVTLRLRSSAQGRGYNFYVDIFGK